MGLTVWISLWITITICVLDAAQTPVKHCVKNTECTKPLLLDHDHGHSTYFHLSDMSGDPDDFTAWQIVSPHPQINYITSKDIVRFYIQPINMPESGSFEVHRVCLNTKNVAGVQLEVVNFNVDEKDYRHHIDVKVHVADKTEDHVCYSRKFFATGVIVKLKRYLDTHAMSVTHFRLVACGDKEEDTTLQPEAPIERPIDTDGPTCVNQHLVTSAEDEILQVSSRKKDVGAVFMDSNSNYTGSPGKSLIFRITPRVKPVFGWVGICLEVHNAYSVYYRAESADGDILRKRLVMCDHSVVTRFCTGPRKADYAVVMKLTMVIKPYIAMQDLALTVKGMHIKTCGDFLVQG